MQKSGSVPFALASLTKHNYNITRLPPTAQHPQQNFNSRRKNIIYNILLKNDNQLSINNVVFSKIRNKRVLKKKLPSLLKDKMLQPLALACLLTKRESKSRILNLNNTKNLKFFIKFF